MRQIECGKEFAHQIGQVGDALLGHIVLQAKNHVVDDTVAVLHHGCAHLHVAAAKLDEFQGRERPYRSLGQRFYQFSDAYRAVVVDAGLFRRFQFVFGAVLHPLPCNGFIPEPYRSHRSGRVAVPLIIKRITIYKLKYKP